MGAVTLATFNCENLFARYKFEKKDKEKAIKDGWLANKAYFYEFDKFETGLTAAAIKETDADIIALQEVESNATLRKFRDKYLGVRRKYKEYLVIDGNDYLRLINVGILSAFHIENIRTHIHEVDKKTNDPLFSRDCLECDFALPENKRLTLFINHFKSMYNSPDPCNGRTKTHEKRLRQAKRLKEIVLERFPEGNSNFAIVGDLNDYLDSKSAITELVTWNEVENIVTRLPKDMQWTQYWEGNKRYGLDETYHQLDYILVSKSLAYNNSNAIPKIIRKGLPKNAKQYRGPRFKNGGKKSASTHCPVAIKLYV